MSRYLILCKERANGIAVWWRPDRRGYTNNVDAAGRYSKEEADSIAGIRGEDFPVPEKDIGETLFARRIVDVSDGDNFEQLKHFEARASGKSRGNL